MRIDLYTLYFLAIGTLLLSAAMTLWERQGRCQRRRELTLLAAGYLGLAAGCMLAMARARFPAPLGAMAANLVMITGYILVLEGTAALRGGQRYRLSLAIWLIVAAGWALAGWQAQDALWNYASALPIGVVSALTAWELSQNRQLRRLRTWRVVIAFPAVHAAFYLFRGCVLPALSPSLLPLASTLTMYEGVLYSVGLPMALLALLREEAQDALLANAYTDYLTNLGNRRRFFEEGPRRLAAAMPSARLFLLAIDLDHFKAINDRFGHATGDDVLRTFARTAKQVLGDQALVARMGGEEFAALISCASAVEAKALAQKMTSHFAQAASERHGESGLKATISIGLSELGRDGVDLPSLLSAADLALYQAKSGGRNRIMVARSEVLQAVG